MQELTPSESELIQSAESMLPELRSRGDEIEAARRLPKDISARLAKAGFYRSLIPSAYGGLECSPATVARLLETLAQGDASAAWVTLVAATSGSALARLPAETSRKVVAKPEIMICGVFAPRGRATRVESGYRVTGRWQWGSGVQNAHWVLGGCILFKDGNPELDASGSPRMHMALVPSTDVHILDTWNVSGLCGTGSTDFEMRDVFVPDENLVGFLDIPMVKGALQVFPHFGLLAMCVAAVGLGIGRAAVRDLIELSGRKKPFGSSRTLAERASTQHDLAEAEALLGSARAYFYETIGEAWEAAKGTGELTIDHRLGLRLASTNAVRSAARAVDLIYELGGGTSVYKASRLQKHFRDIHVVTQHIMVGTGTLEVAGRLLLGLEADTSQF